MKQHRYRITVEQLASEDGGTPGPLSPLQFEAGNHDEILGLVERMRERGIFDPESAAAFTVGLKLFSEVMLENRKDPLFEEFLPQFAQFMKRLKALP